MNRAASGAGAQLMQAHDRVLADREIARGAEKFGLRRVIDVLLPRAARATQQKPEADTQRQAVDDRQL